MKKLLKQIARGQEGKLMIMVLVLLVVGGLVLAPLLGLMSTGLVAGQVYEKKASELYAADAGVEDAIWRIQNGKIDFSSGDYYEYPEHLIVNGSAVMVQIERYLKEGTAGCHKEYMYQIISTAHDEGRDSSTTVEAYMELKLFDLFSGALVSSGDITFNKDCTVTGDVFYVGVIKGKDYTLDGDEIQVSKDFFPTQEDNEALAQQFKDEAWPPGTDPLPGLTIDSDTTLGPNYILGNLYIESDVILTLNGTIYVEGSITAKKDYTVAGSGSIVAVGDIYLSKLADYGIAGDTIIMSLNGNITFKKEATIEAFVYAPNGTIKFDKDATVIGSVVGAEIEIDKDSSFNYTAKASSIGFAVLVPYGADIKTYTIS